jgi:hypothetical protein
MFTKEDTDMIKTPITPPPEIILEDSIQVGILKALGCTFTPESDDSGHVQFRITGDVDGCLAKLYQNHQIGALDVLQAIKTARQAIFSLRKGNGRNYGNSKH